MEVTALCSEGHVEHPSCEENLAICVYWGTWQIRLPCAVKGSVEGTFLMTEITGGCSSVSVVPRTKEKFNPGQCRHSCPPQCKPSVGCWISPCVRYVLGATASGYEAVYSHPELKLRIHVAFTSVPPYLILTLRLKKYSDNFTMVTQDTVPFITPCTIYNSKRHCSTNCCNTVYNYCPN
jgi:hypothetical protein